MKAGVCRFCGCSEFDACVVDDGFGPVGCHWIDPIRTVCSACAPAAKAETHALAVHPELAHSPSRFLAYHYGFLVGWFSLRGPYKRNPYAPGLHRLRRRVQDAVGEKARLWIRGQMAGEAAARQQQLSSGLLENAPRRAVLQDLGRRRRPVRRVTRPARRR